LGLLLVGYALPIMSVETGSRYTEATLTSGPEILLRRGEWEVALVLVVTLLLAPLTQAVLLLVAAVNVPFAPQQQYWRAKVLAGIPAVSRWSMLEVFLVGIVVAWTRLSQWLTVRPTPALLALLGATLAVQVALRALSAERLLSEAPPTRAPRQLSSYPARESPQARIRNPWIGLNRCGALTLGGLLLYIPANLEPIINIKRLTEGGPTTIMSGVEELFRDGSWFLAAVVFLASIAVPLLKLSVLAVLVVMTLLRSPRALRARTRLYRLIAGIGRWSMLDIFVLSVLVSLVRLGVLGYVAAEPGALAFCAVVVITMFATEVFEPKLMWDAAIDRVAVARLPGGAHS
jgi:paraquat-inducible protein A